MPSTTVAPTRHPSQAIRAAASLALALLALAGCRHDADRAEISSPSLVDASERHPILVTQQPVRLALRIPRSAMGLTPDQLAQATRFLSRYRAADMGNGKLVISVPSGTANEIAAVQAAAEIRALGRDIGFDDSAIAMEPVADHPGAQPPLRLSYVRYVATGPQCGAWPANVSDNRENVAYADFGCAMQRNFASQIANPADLIGPRTETPRTSDRRDQVWNKWLRGESTISQRQSDEKTKE